MHLIGFRRPTIHKACHEAAVSSGAMLIKYSIATVALMICEASLRVIA